jgi:hypothetical protein
MSFSPLAYGVVFPCVWMLCYNACCFPYVSLLLWLCFAPCLYVVLSACIWWCCLPLCVDVMPTGCLNTILTLLVVGVANFKDYVPLNIVWLNCNIWTNKFHTSRKRRHTMKVRVEFEPKIPVFERDVITSTHKGRRHHMQVERMTYKQGAEHDHNNRLTYGKQHVNTQAATV